MDKDILPIGGIGNYYGGLYIKEENMKFFWTIDDYDYLEWEEIPEFLYKALLKYEQERNEEQF